MSINIVVPEMGESIVDARVAKWLKNEGDAVSVGEALVELETDKVDVEVSAPKGGVLQQIAHQKGDDVKIGDVLGTIREGESPNEERPPEESESASAAGRASGGGAPRASKERPPEESESAPAAGAGVGPRANEGKPAAKASDAGAPRASKERPPEPVAATPSARRLAREQHVDLQGVRPEGPRVTKDDVARASAPQPAAAGANSIAETRAAAPAQTLDIPRGRERTEERIRMSKRRATIARRLVEVQQTAAMLTTFNEVDMSAVMALRERQKQTFKDQHGVSLGIASFFVKAAIAALREFPRLNAEVQGDEMVLKHYFDIGVAVGAAEGLVVPVLRDADALTFADIEIGIRAFAAKAKDGSLTLDDLRGGTFSITNGGVFGSLMSTPILNPPQVGILGLHTIKERPVGVDGQIVLRPMMFTALTYDHRIVDGAEAVQFLVRVKTFVEDPGVLLIGS